MNKKELMKKFIKQIEKKGLLTLLIKNIFDYENICDHNYIYRMKEDTNSIIIDIYDNISEHRFNRYIFLFSRGNFDINIKEDSNVFITSLYINKAWDSDNKLIKLAYLFKLNNDKMISYAQTFLYQEFIDILNEILNKSIC